MKVGERDQDTEQSMSRTKSNKERTEKDESGVRDKDKNKVDTLQATPNPKHPSRSQSPAMMDLRMEAYIQGFQEPPSSTSSKHSSEKSHHSKSHSKDLGSSVAQNINAQQSSSRTTEDSPQKLAMNASTTTDYGNMICSPGLSAGLNANASLNTSGEEYPSPQPSYRNQSGDVEVDGACSSSSARISAAVDHLNNKIARTKNLIRLEQTIRDENVNEYLKLSQNADKQQLQRIKAVFEKKNQKSAHSIAQYQKKIEGYEKRIKNWETHGSSGGHGSHRPREMLRDMGQGLKNVGGNIRDGITGLGGSVMSKPREFAHLIKNKFGSADNINQMAAPPHPELRPSNNWTDGRRPEGEGNGSHTLPGAHRSEQSANTASPNTTNANQSQNQNKLTSEEGSECSSVTSESIPGYQNQSGRMLGDDIYSLKPILKELHERREEIERLQEKFECVKTLSQEVQYLNSALYEEKCRSERLEEQINDLTELHQNEVENLKQALADVEEKVQYQSEERVRDMYEMLELCQTKISKLEHQAMQQQQYVNLESIEGLNARAIAVKLINILLTVLHIILLLVATAAGILMPFLRTRDELKPRNYGNNGHHTESLFLHIVRILTTSLVVIGAVYVLKQWPEVWEISSHLMDKLRKTIVSTDHASIDNSLR